MTHATYMHKPILFTTLKRIKNKHVSTCSLTDSQSYALAMPLYIIILKLIVMMP